MKITTTFQQRYQHLIFAIFPTKIWYFSEPFSTPLFFGESAAALTTRAPWIPPRKSSTPATHPIHRHQPPGIGCCRWNDNFLFSILPNSEGSDFEYSIVIIVPFISGETGQTQTGWLSEPRDFPEAKTQTESKFRFVPSQSKTPQTFKLHPYI